MSDVETQASQRTVIAFISGLLIGGLLVWVFTATPENADPIDADIDADVESVEVNEGDNELISASSEENASGSLTVSDQAAGEIVTIDKVTYPSEDGWIVVRDYADGVAGNVLGAARYDAATGLKPMSVKLLRATIPGASYEVLFYSNEGDKAFTLAEDMPIADTGVRFSAN